MASGIAILRIDHQRFGLIILLLIRNKINKIAHVLREVNNINIIIIIKQRLRAANDRNDLNQRSLVISNEWDLVYGRPYIMTIE